MVSPDVDQPLRQAQHGRTALLIALSSARQSDKAFNPKELLFNIILQHSPPEEVNMSDYNGTTALGMALDATPVNIVILHRLLERKANPNILTKSRFLNFSASPLFNLISNTVFVKPSSIIVETPQALIKYEQITYPQLCHSYSTQVMRRYNLFAEMDHQLNSNSKIEAAQMLLTHNTDPNYKGLNGKTPLSIVESLPQP